MKRSVHTVLMFVLCLVLSLSGLHVGVSATRAADTGTWTQLPVYGGNVYSLAINPLTPPTLYAGTASGGVFRSTDSGDHWTAVNTGLSDPRVIFLAVNPLTPTTLYAGTVGGGIFRSTDSGATWTAVNTGLNNADVRYIAINPTSPTTLYTGTDGNGVFRSTDSGATWTAVNTGLTKQTVYSLAINPATPSTLYAGTNGGVFRSTDSGTTWTAVNTGLTTGWVVSVAINPLTISTLYAGTYGGGVFRSTDSGDHWTAMNTGLTNTKVQCVTIDPLTPAPRYAGHDGSVFRHEAKKQTVIVLKIGNSKFTVNGASTTLDSPPVIKNGRTLVPIRAIIEALGGTVGWDATTKKVTVTLGKKTIDLWIGKSAATVNGVSTPIDSTDVKVVPEIINGRTMLPLRFVTESLGATVAWEQSTQTITITYAP